jgi:5-oxoprolinase (ATP-hydrolysing)
MSSNQLSVTFFIQETRPNSQIKILSRANSAVADAYLTPVTRRYIESFASGFEGGLESLGDKLLFMQSDGGLCQWDRFSGLRAVLSGPAGGVIGKLPDQFCNPASSYQATQRSATMTMTARLLWPWTWAELRPMSHVTLGHSSTSLKRQRPKVGLEAAKRPQLAYASNSYCHIA